MFWKPRKGNKNYPLDLDAGLHHTRFAKTVTPTPYPPIIGAVRSVLPFQDILAISMVRARSPSGPGVAVLAVFRPNGLPVRFVISDRILK